MRHTRSPTFPVDLQAIERWVRDRGQWIGLTGKNQVLGGKARIATEGIVSDFEPEKLLARSLLDKPEAFTGPTLRILVVDDPFVDGVTGDGAFLVRASAARDCERTVTQRVRRCLAPEIQDAKRGQVYMRLEFEEKVARHDTEILSVTEDGDLLYLTKRERARIDTGGKLVHEAGFKGTAVVVDMLPDHIEREPPAVPFTPSGRRRARGTRRGTSASSSGGRCPGARRSPRRRRRPWSSTPFGTRQPRSWWPPASRSSTWPRS